MTYVAAVYKPLEAISSTIGSLQDQIVGLKITFELLDTETEITDIKGAHVLVRPWGRVTFKDVDFSYAGRADTLRDINVEARPGSKIALVGPTGAGKTTLISLIPRFYDPSRGRVEIDGVDVRKLTLKSLRAHVGLVQQEPILFSDTISNNIRYGRLEATSEEIVAAARAANAHDFIMGLPNQYETVIGERGAKLSGGERQRISVARAFLKDAPILILDEPTSSIDSRTESVILDALDRLMEGRTTFMVAHRLSTIRNADQILVLNHGRIVESGTHDELLERQGLYRQLYEMQAGKARRRA
jgi:ABC-type multidrug transport system fused ATPase/permease subunit